MDNNNPQQAPMPNTPPVNSVIPQTPIPSAPAENSNKLILWLIIGLVVVAALVGGIYLFLSNQQAAPKPLTSSPAPARSAQENLENGLDSIDVDSAASSIESDFTQLDQDIQQL